MSTNLDLSKVDFSQLKEQFKTFLKGQSKYQDYNFEGSGLNVILDILIANTVYQNYYLNQIASEMFIRDAVLRNNVVGRAKHLNYVPRSVKTARAQIKVTINPALGPLDPDPLFILIDTSNQFSTFIDSRAYTFSPDKSYIINPVDGVYSIDMTIIEGQRLTYRWTVDNSGPTRQRFIIPNPGIDTDTIVVKLQNSIGDTTQTLFLRSEDITAVETDEPVYFLQEADNEKFEIYFGDGVIGRKPTDGNIVIVEYIVSSGDVVNGASIFTALNKVAGYNSSTIETLEPAGSANEIESIESIKLLAPLNYESQNRAVTTQDYETLLKKDDPNIEFIRVWGGEENDPPVFGKVYASVKLKDRFRIPANEKETLINNIIRPRNVVAIEPILVEPDYLRIVVDTEVRYSKARTTLTDSDIQSAVTDSILGFKESELIGFDSNFRYSRLVGSIDSTNSAITGNLTDISLKYRMFPVLNVATNFKIQLNNPIDRGDVEHGISTLTSTGFIHRGILTYIADNGQGVLYFYRIVLGQRVVVEDNIGTINYTTGEIVLNGLEVQSIPGNKDYVDLYVVPQKKDIHSLRNQILLLEPEDITVRVIGVP